MSEVLQYIIVYMCIRSYFVSFIYSENDRWKRVIMNPGPKPGGSDPPPPPSARQGSTFSIQNLKTQKSTKYETLQGRTKELFEGGGASGPDSSRGGG